MEKSTKNNSFKSYIDFIQKYYSQLLFIPLLFGGIMQVVLLFQISPQAIRFFSPSQAIADGLFFLSAVFLFIISAFIIFLIAIVYGFIYNAGDIRKPAEEVPVEKNQYKYSHEKMSLYAHIFNLIGVFLCYYLLFIGPMRITNFTEANIQNLLTYGFFAILINFGFSITLMRFIYYKKEFYFEENQPVFLTLNYSLCLFTVLCFSISSTNNSNFVANFKFLEHKYNCEKSGVIKITYFNDKYIFIERNCVGKKKEIIIEKFEALFDLNLKDL